MIRRLNKFKLDVSRILGGLTMGLLLVGVACGAAATATPPPTSAPTSGTPVVIGPTPTAALASTPAPNEPIVSTGKVIWMAPGWGSERFDVNFGGSAGNNHGKLWQGFLVATNDKVELLPGIATKWEISSDGRTWTFTIRDGVKFHDGTVLSTEDVWWTLMHYWGKDASGVALERSNYSTSQLVGRSTERVEQPAPNQVSITTKAFNADLSRYLSEDATDSWYGVMPKRPNVHDDTQEAAFDKNPIGAGRLKLVRHVPVELMAFERFDDYYYQPKNGLPEDRRVRFKFFDLRLVPEEATRVAAVRSGEADIAPVSLGSRKQVEAGAGRIVFGPEGQHLRAYFLGCWKTQFPCHDKRVRQALDLAIDKNLFREKLFGGPEVFEAKGWDIVTPSTVFYSPDLDPWPQDVGKARQLLAEAGYADGNGFGKVIINTYVSTAMPLLPESAQLAADFWRNVLNLDVEVKVGDESDLKKKALADELHGQMFWRDNNTARDTNFLTFYGTPEQGNRLHEDPELFALVQQANAIIDPAERKVAFNKVAKRLREESYQMGLGYFNLPYAVGPRVAAWEPWPMAYHPTNLQGITLK